MCLRSYKYTLTTKGNLLKHLQVIHGHKLDSHRQERQQSLNRGQLSLTGDAPERRKSLNFHKQDVILTALVRNLCARFHQLYSVQCNLGSCAHHVQSKNQQ